MNRAGASFLVTLVLGWGAADTTTAQAPPARFDCVAGSCPALVIEADDISRYPNGQPAGFRGFADPCIRRDPGSGSLWMVYSWPHMEYLGGGGRRSATRARFALGVETHLASSKDGGRTWRRESVLWPKTPARYRHPVTRAEVDGFVSHEVPNIVPFTGEAGTAWAGVRLDYFLGRDGSYRARNPRSFCLRLMTAASPAALARAEPVTFGTAENAPECHVDADLRALARDLPAHFIPNEPALFFDDGRLYLAFVARPLAGSTPAFPESRIVVLSTQPRGDVGAWKWRYQGTLAAHREATELGGEALTQIELARGRDGQLLALLTPEVWDAELAREFGSDPFGGIVHKGVAVVEVASLETPALARRGDGTLAVRTFLTASAGGERGAGAAGYDPASSTGVLLTLRDIVPKQYLAFSLHRTGRHP